MAMNCPNTNGRGEHHAKRGYRCAEQNHQAASERGDANE